MGKEKSKDAIDERKLDKVAGGSQRDAQRDAGDAWAQAGKEFGAKISKKK